MFQKKFVKHLKFSSKSLFRNNLFSEQFYKCSGEIFKIVLKNGLVCSETINLFRKHPDCSEILRCFQKCSETFWLLFCSKNVFRSVRELQDLFQEHLKSVPKHSNLCCFENVPELLFCPKTFHKFVPGTFHKCSSQIFKICFETFCLF